MIRKITSEPSIIYPGITVQRGVCGGDPCIARTRIPVWVLAAFRQLGTSNRRLLRMYPDLTMQDLKNAWHYADTHAEEIARQIEENERP